MKVIGINGSARKDGNTSLLIKAVFAELEAEGIETDLVQLHGKALEPCKACFGCGGKRQCVVKTDYFNECFAKMVEAGCEYAVMEVSSHALELHRVDGIPFTVGAFTNLTEDHLDFHKTMEAYGAAKARLFRLCRNRLFVLWLAFWGALESGFACISHMERAL